MPIGVAEEMPTSGPVNARAAGIPVDGKTASCDVATSTAGAYHAMYVESPTAGTVHVGANGNANWEGNYSTSVMCQFPWFAVHSL